MSYRHPGPNRYKKLETLGEAIAVMAEAGERNATFYIDLREHELEVKTWYTNGDFAGTDYYTIPKEVADKLISMTEGTLQWGYTSETERRLSGRYREQYYEGLRQAREIEEAIAEEIRKKAEYEQGIIDAERGLGE